MSNLKKDNIYISFVIQAYEEGNDVKGFLKELVDEIEKMNKDCEIIFLDGDTKNNSQKTLEEMKKNHRFIQYHVLHHPGVAVVDKANKYNKGFELAKGKYIVQMDADGQDVPKEVPKFIEKLDEGYDMVTGWKQKRKDSFFYKLTSKFFNKLTMKLTGVHVHDMNNGFKAYKSHVAKSLNLKGGYFRFIPLILTKHGYIITEVPVEHRKRAFGKGKFSFISRSKGIFDLISLLMVLKMNGAPFYFFGWGGLIFFLKGIILLILSFFLYYTYELYFLGIFLLVFSSISLLLSSLMIILGIIVEYFRFYEKNNG